MEALVPYHAILDGLLLATDSTSTDQTGGSWLGLLFPLVLFGGLFYFALILPQRRRQRQMQDMRNSVEVGDRVRTIGGIYGKVTKIEGDDATIDVGGGTKLQVTLRAIADRLGESDS
jgi:preprotein translocase subunit YajC